MDNETLFYVLGAVLAVSAVVFSLAALRADKLPSRVVPVVFVWFALLTVAATTFAVRQSQDEELHREEAAGLPHATEEAEEEEEQ